MLLRRSCGSVAFLAALLPLASCQTAPTEPTPEAPDRALGILSMIMTLSTPLGTTRVTAAATLGKVDAAGNVEKEVRPTGGNGKYVIFANLEPGMYKVLRAVHRQSSGPGPAVPVGGGFGIGISYSQTYTAEFDPEAARRTLVEVPAAAVAYLGDFSVPMKHIPGIPPRSEAGQPSREFTEGGRRRAYEALKAVRPDSPWVSKLKPPVFGAFVVELTEEVKKKTGTENGVLISAVGGDFPASNAGMQGGDVLTQIGDRRIANLQSYDDALDQYAGKTAIVKYVRYENEERSVEVRFNERMQ